MDGPSADEKGAPFIGIGPEEPDSVDWTGGVLTLKLSIVTGPGDFPLWQDDGYGRANIFFDSATYLDSITLFAGSHTHFNWVYGTRHLRP